MADSVRMTHSNGTTVTVAADAVERLERMGFTKATRSTTTKATAKKATARKSSK